ncbi:unnamed protein product [Haemonchus placei]|uniref:Anaphase-promoting complex subunit 1 n=1 Tax=Haemonchus placei TaxID=6290 RepID=A0A158QPA8_HAEPC|nr:unnamed protein product [Haemonchus placei]
MIESTSAENNRLEDVMIPTTKRCIPLPYFKGNADKLLFCQRTGDDGPSIYAIAVDREVVVLLGTGKTILRQDVPFDIRQLLWIVFPPSKSEIETAVTQEFFCIVGLRDLMFIAINDSHPLGFRVQFDIHAVYATKFGLLVERDLTSFGASAEDQVALYSLSHPLNELLAVIFKPRDSLTQWLFCWEKSEYRIIGAEDDFLLVFDRISEVHSLLRIRITSEHEVQSAIELLEKRRTEMFLSHNVLSQEFVNFFVGTINQLRSIRAVHTVAVAIRMIRVYPVFTITGCAWCILRGGDLTVVLEMDNSFGLYSGHFTITPSMILHSADNSSFVVQHENKLTKATELTRVILPSAFINYLARDLFAAVVDVLPREKALRLMLDWKTNNRNYENELEMSVEEPQLHTAVRFILEQAGIIIEEHKRLPWRKKTTMNEICETDAKQRRPKASAEEVGVLELCEVRADESGIRTHAPEGTGALNQRLRPLGHLATGVTKFCCKTADESGIRTHAPEGTGALNQRLGPLGHLAMETSATFVFDQRLKFISAKNSHANFPFLFQNFNRILKFREAITGGQAKIGVKSEKTPVNVVVKIDSTAPLHGNVYAVIGAIHASFEEWSLDCGLFHLKSQIVYYLHAAASVLGLEAYSSHYKAEFNDCSDCIYEVQRNDGLAVDEFPSPYGHMARNFSVDHPFSLWKSVADLLQLHLTHSLAGSTSKVARLLTVLGVGLGTGRLALMTDVHRLLGRNWERRLRLRPDQVDKVAEIMFSKTRTPAQKSFPQPEEMAQIARIRWPRDVRRDNVRAMLDSTKPVLIATQHLDAGTDGEIREAQEQFLNATWIRYLAQAFGRAFFTFRTVLPNPAESLFVPELCLSARIYPSNLTYDLTLTEPLRQLREWGEFYNGVAAGLSVVGADVAHVDHEWLTLCHTSDKISPPTASGLLYALGLNGHLPNFNTFYVHEVLATLDKFSSIALLLGMAMSKIGTADRQVRHFLVQC